MNRDDIIRMAKEAGFMKYFIDPEPPDWITDNCERFAALVAAAEREACVDIIEAYQIPVGNSAAGELACEWTYDALHEIRDDIRARGEG